jgi:hypothetical protein
MATPIFPEFEHPAGLISRMRIRRPAGCAARARPQHLARTLCDPLGRQGLGGLGDDVADVAHLLGVCSTMAGSVCCGTSPASTSGASCGRTNPSPRTKSWRVSRDPDFVAKAAEIVDLYLAPPDGLMRHPERLPTP